jgi:hypothetical protein
MKGLRTAIAAAIDESRVVDVLREAGLSLKDASAAASKITGTSRREVYQNAVRRERR